MTDVASALRARHVHLVLATSTGGVGRHVRGLARGLADVGSHVTVHGPQATDDLFGFASAGVGFEAVEIASGIAPRADTLAWRTLRQSLRGADLVHAHGFRAGLVAGLAVPRRALTRPVYLVTWHNAVLDDARIPGLHHPIERVIARAADVTIAVSRDLADRARELGATDVRVLPVGGPALPQPARAPAEVRTELGADGPIVLTVGRLHRQKGIDVLIRAATAWADRRPRPTLVVAGEGPEREALFELAARVGVPLLLLGHRDDVADLLAAADVVVLPSRWEGSPLAAREVLAAGRPLVATRVGGMPDLVDDTAARLVPADDPSALATAVTEMLDHPDAAYALAEHGRQQVQSWPDEAASVTNVLALYAERLSVRRPPAE